MLNFKELHHDVIKHAAELPKSSKSASMYHKETSAHKRMMEREKEAVLIATLILAASALHPGERHAIQKFQKNPEALKIHGRKIEGAKETIEGEGTQFYISTSALVQYMSNSSI